MIEDRDFDRVLGELYAPSGDRLPEHVLDDALARAWRVRRRRGWRIRWGPAWDSRDRGPALVLAALLTLGALAGVMALAGSPLPADPMKATAIAPPSAEPTRAIPGADGLSGSWVGIPVAGGGGAWRLRLSDFATLDGPAGEYQILRGWTVDGDVLRVPPGIADCANLAGAYRFRLDGDELRLAVLDDPCSGRADPLGSLRWQRVPDDRGVANRFRVPFTYPVSDFAHALQEVTTTLHWFGGSHVDSPDLLYVWIIEEVFAGACPPATPAASRRIEPGAAALVEHLARSAGVDADAPIATTVAGRPATLVRLSATAETCDAGPIRLWVDRGQAVGAGVSAWPFDLATGEAAQIRVVEVDGQAIAFVTKSSANSTPVEQHAAIVEDIRFVEP